MARRKLAPTPMPMAPRRQSCFACCTTSRVRAAPWAFLCWAATPSRARSCCKTARPSGASCCKNVCSNCSAPRKSRRCWPATPLALALPWSTTRKSRPRRMAAWCICATTKPSCWSSWPRSWPALATRRAALPIRRRCARRFCSAAPMPSSWMCTSPRARAPASTCCSSCARKPARPCLRCSCPRAATSMRAWAPCARAGRPISSNRCAPTCWWRHWTPSRTTTSPSRTASSSSMTNRLWPSTTPCCCSKRA